MRPIAAAALALAVVAFGAARLHTSVERTPAPLAAPRPAPTQPEPPASKDPSTRAAPRGLTDELDVEAIARRWVTATWTRQPGDAPFAWLERVAHLATPELLDALRAARPILADTDPSAAVGVEVAGVYPDALDPHTVTVVCTLHRDTALGAASEPCVATVTAARTVDGRVLVAAVR